MRWPRHPITQRKEVTVSVQPLWRWRGAARSRIPVVISGIVAISAIPAANAVGAPSASASASPLTITVQDVPPTLDPGKSANGLADITFASLAYAPLIYLAPNGTYEPELATSWHYVGNANEQFVLNLRKGVRFSDGSRLTAQDVVKSIEYAKGAGSTASTYLTSLTSVTASGPLTVDLRFSSPRPDLPTVFDQNEMAGDIIGPSGLASPSKLGTRTDGAGPYMLDASKTVTGSSYVYVPNPHYWNAAQRRFSQVTVSVIADTNAELNALRTGQADFMEGGTPAQAKTASGAGLKVYKVPTGWTALFIEDYGGKLVKALGSKKVRQAINYATDRPLLARALFGAYASPNDETSSPGFTGYVPGLSNYYSYDVAKAKKLLKEAGYPRGFTMSVVSTPSDDIETEVEALASELSQVGITIKIHEDPTFSEAITDWLSRKYPAFVGTYGTLPMSIEAPQLWFPNATFNPFHNPQPVIVPLINRADKLDGSAANALYQQAERTSLVQGYYDVLFDPDELYFARPGVIANVEIGSAYPGSALGPDPAFWAPAR